MSTSASGTSVSGGDGQKQPEAAPQAAAMDTTASMVTGVVGGLNALVQSAVANMASSLSKSAAAVSSMSNLMDQAMQRSLVVSSRVVAAVDNDGSGHAGASVTVKLHNNWHIPMQGATMTAQLLRRGSSEGSEWEPCTARFTCPSVAPCHKAGGAGGGGETDVPSADRVESRSDVGGSDPVPVFGGAIAPGATVSVRLLVEPPALEQYNLRFSVSFPSPGTKRPLSVVHMCGLYIIHQCRVTATSDAVKSSEESGQAAHSLTQDQARSLRDVLQVPATAGLLGITWIVAPPGDTHAAHVAVCVRARPTGAATDRSSTPLQLVAVNVRSPASGAVDVPSKSQAPRGTIPYGRDESTAPRDAAECEGCHGGCVSAAPKLCASTVAAELVRLCSA